MERPREGEIFWRWSRVCNPLLHLSNTYVLLHNSNFRLVLVTTSMLRNEGVIGMIKRIF